MSMITQCPSCATTFRVTPPQLQSQHGMVRCGRCATVFDGFKALATLPGDAALEAVARPSLPPEIEKRTPPPVPVPEIPASETVAVEALPTVVMNAVPAAAEQLPLPQAVSEPALVPQPDAAVAESEQAQKTDGPPEPEHVPQPQLEQESPLEPKPLEPQPVPELKPAFGPEPEPGPAPASEPKREAEPVPAFQPDAAVARPVGEEFRAQTIETFAPPPPPRRRTAVWAAGALVLLCGLAVQFAYLYRGEIAAAVPETRPYLNDWCEILGCTVALPQRPRQISIEASDMQAADTANPGLVILTATLRNQATTTLGYPALDVVLTNTREHTVARRIFLPSEYLADKRDWRAGMTPSAEITIRLNIDSGDLGAAGFRLDLIAAPAS